MTLIDDGNGYYIDDMVVATKLSRRMCLSLVKQFEDITGQRVTRVMRRNFLTPKLTEEQFELLVNVGTAKDGYSYAERIRGEFTGNPLESSAPVVNGGTLDTSKLEAQVSRVEAQLAQLTEGTDVKKLEADVAEIKTQVAQMVVQLDTLKDLILRIPAELTKSLLESPDDLG